MDMNYCMHCGTELIMKEHPTEGTTPWCTGCRAWRYPVFNTAVSMVVTNPEQNRMILIQQYGKPWYVLVAGYVNKGEDAEHAAVREIREEIGMEVKKLHFNHSRYYRPTNTLMLNFTAIVEEEEAHPNWEVDSWKWFSIEEAKQQVKPGSLAAAFLKGYLSGRYEFPEL